jgi:hypothetical protein
MILKLKQIIFVSSTVLIILLFSTCKKYPESNLWFKNPERIDFISGHMTHYIVNGIDSIDFLDNYFYDDKYNKPYVHKFSEINIASFLIDKGSFQVTFFDPEDYVTNNSNVISGIPYSYKEKGKKIKISNTNRILETYKKNIFISDDILWEIVYLKKNDNKRKMKGIYNGNTYEIQFN